MKVDTWDEVLSNVRLSPCTNLVPAKDLIVKIPEHNLMCDEYIDDGVMFGIDLPTNRIKLTHAGPIITRSIFRDAGEDHDMNWDPALSIDKLKAELAPSTTKKVLGWLLDTDNLRMFLPQDKSLDWINSINSLLQKGHTTTKELESLIGKLNHAAHIIPLSRYFLSRLRFRLKKCKEWGRQRLAEWDKQDLSLWRKFLTAAA